MIQGWLGRADCKGAQGSFGLMEVFHAVIMVVFTQGYAFVKT